MIADNWTFVAAAYGLTAIVLLGYWRRLAKKERELEALSRRNAERRRAEPSSRPPLDESPLQQHPRP